MLLTEYDEKATMDYIRREAQQIGEAKATERVNKLVSILIAKGQYEELKRTTKDLEYQKELFQKYDI